MAKEGIACYQTFVRGLLDLTDNLVDGKIVPPADTVRHDEDDPYLVVAADKGTATFLTLPMACLPNTTFGSKMLLPQGAVQATTTKAWALPHAGRGRVSNATLD